jgi:hypothetical protein
MKLFAVGATAVGTAALVGAFDKRAGEHFPECTEAANQSTAQVQIGVDRHGAPFNFCLQLILV